MDDSPPIDRPATAVGGGRASDVAGDDPDHRDLLSATRPVRTLPAALRRGVPIAVLAVAALVVVSRWWDPAEPGARIVAGLVSAAVPGLGAWLLLPGRSPWRHLRPAAGLRRRAAISGMITLGVMVALLIAYAVTGVWVLPFAALAAVPVLWCCGFAETTGGASREWWRATRKELREVWTEPAQKSGHR